MIKNSATIGRNGIQDFLILRVTSLILLAYFIYLFILLISADISVEFWRAFFESTGNKTFSLLALISFIAHAWIGMWQVLSDYIQPRLLNNFKPGHLLRGLLMLGVIITLLVYLILGILIIIR